MAKKSAAALSIVTPLQRRPEPPSDLNVEQGELWREIVAGKPADWFGRDTQVLLVQYCRHKSRAAAVARMIEGAPEEGGDLKALFAMEKEQSTIIAALATKLRLTQQSRYTPHRASSEAAKATTPAKPWEYAKSG